MPVRFGEEIQEVLRSELNEAARRIEIFAASFV
jgi:hypothetical protein